MSDGAKPGERGAARRIIARLILLLFVGQALVPAGFMPDPDALRAGRIDLVICTAAGLAGPGADAATHAPPSSGNTGKSDRKDCPYHTVASKVLVLSGEAPLPVFYDLRSEPLPADGAAHMLAAAQGPPLGSRAPPSRLG
jgi:hypothetical protein